MGEEMLAMKSVVVGRTSIVSDDDPVESADQKFEKGGASQFRSFM
jgi:hypothetical protein